MPCMGFEPTIPTSKRAKTVHALDRSATVTVNVYLNIESNYSLYFVTLIDSCVSLRDESEACTFNIHHKQRKQ
jgi:hypothetical protein